MHTTIQASQLRAPKITNFSQKLGSQKPANVPPKVAPTPSTAKKLPIVGISA